MFIYKLSGFTKKYKSEINCTYVSISKETKVLVYCVQSMDTQIHVNVQVL